MTYTGTVTATPRSRRRSVLPVSRPVADLLLRGGFIDRHIFPDGELLQICEVVSAAEQAGFEVRDLESWREHYALTLQHWLTRLHARRDEAMRVAGSEMTRAFMLYLAGSIVAFRRGEISVLQLLLAKRN
jgi:cyclopropane-fatty-acyl-phospholipid synthase